VGCELSEVVAVIRSSSNFTFPVSVKKSFLNLGSSNDPSNGTFDSFSYSFLRFDRLVRRIFRNFCLLSVFVTEPGFSCCSNIDWRLLRKGRGLLIVTSVWLDTASVAWANGYQESAYPWCYGIIFGIIVRNGYRVLVSRHFQEKANTVLTRKSLYLRVENSFRWFFNAFYAIPFIKKWRNVCFVVVESVIHDDIRNENCTGYLNWKDGIDKMLVWCFRSSFLYLHIDSNSSLKYQHRWVNEMNEYTKCG
jgi:hypothetical protein